MSKKRILIVSSVFPPEPVTSAYLNYDLALHLAPYYDVTVIHPKPTRPAGRSYGNLDNGLKLPISIIEASTYTHPESELIGRMRESLSFGLFCGKYINNHCDAIDFVYNCSWQLFGYYLVAKSCKRNKIPYMIPIQDVYPESLFTSHHYPRLFKTLVTSILLPIDKYYLRNATIIRTISDEMKDYLIATRRLRQDQFLVVNNWQDDDNFEYVANEERRGVLSFVYVGSINSHSNVELIIKAFVKAKLSNAQLLIYGSGPNKEQCQALVDASCSDQVVFSLVEREDVPRVQSNADVLVLALPKGNGTLCLPSKLTSYLLSGRPVLASVDMDSSTASIINSIEAGIVVIPDDDDLLCDAFKRIYSMPQEQLLLMGQRARCYAEDNLTKAVNLNKVVSAIDKIFKSSNC